MASPLFILDVKEKETTEAKAPSFPQIKSGTSGFPEPKKRNKVSAFKQKRQGIIPDDQKQKVFLSSNDRPLDSPHHGPGIASSVPNVKANEKTSIDRENNQRLASMSPHEIEQARQEIFDGMDPKLLEMLLKRANLDDGANASPFDKPQSTLEATSSRTKKANIAPPEIKVQDTSIKTSSDAHEHGTLTAPSAQSPSGERPPKPHVSEETDEPDSTPTHSNDPESKLTEDDRAPAIPPTEHIIDPSIPDPEAAHWPRAPQPADLDPSDPNFLQNLHDKYFPSLPTDPSKLAWMAPVPTPNSVADRDSPYYPGQDSLPISALRFDFRGALLPPRISRAVPTTKGLHHHGEAPEAAGYTVRELARLARSAVPGQRCMAYQTLGRILYRLGNGDFGGIGQDDVSVGIWREMEEGAVVRSLYDEIGGPEGRGRGRGHLSARVFATEAIWLLEKGGWKEKLRKASP
ncbi:RPAP1-like protein [Xylaria sp. CBS 124048]|nr:RPAP1-like protein [Xylaria sp. CBS 124048]